MAVVEANLVTFSKKAENLHAPLVRCNSFNEDSGSAVEDHEEKAQDENV